MAKDADAFRTIGELSKELGIAQHILRYWETRFPQLQPLKRAGNRRYYRPEDIALVRRIDRLLNEDGYTIKGVQKILSGKAAERPGPAAPGQTPAQARPQGTEDRVPANLIERLEKMRDELAEAIAD